MPAGMVTITMCVTTKGSVGLTTAKGIYGETIACVASSNDHIDIVNCAYVCIIRWFIISILLLFVRGEAKQGRFAAHYSVCFFFTVVEGGFELKIYVWANLYFIVFALGWLCWTSSTGIGSNLIGN